MLSVDLWRWSTAVQLTTALLIALLFLVLTRTTRRRELRVWQGAWVSHLLALVVTMAEGILPSQSTAVLHALRFLHVTCELSFVAMLLVGVAGLGRARPSRGVVRGIIAGITVASLLISSLVDSPDMVFALTSAVIAIALGAGALHMMGARVPLSGWLAAGCSLRSLLAMGESVAHVNHLQDSGGPLGRYLGTFVALSPALAAGAEWLIALGGVFVVFGVIGEELTVRHAGLVTEKDALQRLATSDPLTGASNRRQLAGILHDSRVTGATILFFDVDDFKGINDVHGHHVGDEALQHFARVLRQSFRPGDHVIRYAGDEFIVVGQGIAQVDVAERIAVVRDTLPRERHGRLRPPIHFAVGESYLAIGGDPDAALRAADSAMYRRKAEAKKKKGAPGRVTRRRA
jgi:diguanylate cyclase (GGDEF)-like protein